MTEAGFHKLVSRVRILGDMSHTQLREEFHNRGLEYPADTGKEEVPSRGYMLASIIEDEFYDETFDHDDA